MNTESSDHAVCAVIPAFREAATIAPVVEKVIRHCPCIVVDDGSEDETARVAREAGATVVRHEVNRGKGAALRTGFDLALQQGYRLVITLDADGQHDPDRIPSFLSAFRRTGIPVLVGNRMWQARRMPLVRRLTNRFMTAVLSRYMRYPVPDTQCGFRLYEAEILPHVSVTDERFAAESEILLHLARRNIRIDSVRVSTVYIPGRRSRISPLRDTVRFLAMLIREYRTRRMRHRPRERAH